MRPTLLTTLRSGKPAALASPSVKASSPKARREVDELLVADRLAGHDQHAVGGQQQPELTDLVRTHIGHRQAGHLNADRAQNAGVHRGTSRPDSVSPSAIANRSGVVIPVAAAITATTLWRANEQYRPASRNHGCPSGSTRKSNRL